MNVGSPKHEFVKPKVGMKYFWREWVMLGWAYLTPLVAYLVWHTGGAMQRAGGVMVFFAVVAEFVSLDKASKKHLLNASRAYRSEMPWDFSTADRVIGWCAFFAAAIGTLLWVFGDLLLLR